MTFVLSRRPAISDDYDGTANAVHRRLGVGSNTWGQECHDKCYSFANAQIGSYGSVRGADDLRHDVFKVEMADRATLYGDYFYVFPNGCGNFNIEIGVFGYSDPYNVGNLHRDAREHFSTDDSFAIEHLIRSRTSLPRDGDPLKGF
jgi:hypothetical protein